MSLHRVVPVLVCALSSAPTACGQSQVVTPERVDVTPARIRQLKLPPGFKVQVFAEGLGNPRMLAAAADGAAYVTRPATGDVLLLSGRADQRRVVAREPQIHGITLHDSQAYFATVREVYIADRKPDGAFGPLRQIVSGLPPGGQHPNRTLRVGPDGMLYISAGSTCNACIENNRENATILRSKLDGSGREIFASGLRNTVGFDWHPQTKELWGMDNGTDGLGNDQPPEELNLLVKGANYGWPFVYGKGNLQPSLQPPRPKSKAELAKEARDPVLLYTAHSAPLQMAFYSARMFPAEYNGDAFVAIHGSWNRRPPSGYEIARVRFDGGRAVAIEPFLTGFLMSENGAWTQFGRPAGVAVAADGALLFSDDSNGVIYRVSYSSR